MNHTAISTSILANNCNVSSCLAGYKGYGLSMMVETMCGILSGGPFAQHMRKWQTPDPNTKANLVSKKI